MDVCSPTRQREAIRSGLGAVGRSSTSRDQVKKLLSIPNLVAIETVDSSSLADRRLVQRVASEQLCSPLVGRIASAAQAAGRGEGGIDPLDLFIQAGKALRGRRRSSLLLR